MHFDFVRRTFFTGEAIFQNESGDALAGEPFGYVGAFGIDGKEAMAAAGRDDHGRTCGFVPGRQIDQQGRIVHLREVGGIARTGGNNEFLFAGHSFGAGSAIGPERHGISVL